MREKVGIFSLDIVTTKNEFRNNCWFSKLLNGIKTFLTATAVKCCETKIFAQFSCEFKSLKTFLPAPNEIAS